MSGLDEAWAAAQHSDDDYQPHSGEAGAGMGSQARRGPAQKRQQQQLRLADQPWQAGQGGRKAWRRHWRCSAVKPCIEGGSVRPQPVDPKLTSSAHAKALLLLSPDYEGDDKRRRRAGSRSAAASSGHAWAASAAALQQQQQPSGSGLAGAGMPEVVATEAADGRNVLRIKINRPGKQGEAGAVGAAAGGSARGRGSDPGCPLNFLAGLADGMGTPMGQQGAAGGVAAVGSGAAAAPKDAPKAEPVVLLSKKLLRVGRARGWGPWVLGVPALGSAP